MITTPQPVPTAFFDRDGVLIVDCGYAYKPEQAELISGAPDAVRFLNQRGYRVVVITNQSGIARGLFDETAVQSFHEHLREKFAEQDAYIDAFYYCPHHPQGTIPVFSIDCDCRKPKPGLLEQADRHCSVERKRSFLVGDKQTDIAAAKAFGIRAIEFDPESESLLELVKRAARS